MLVLSLYGPGLWLVWIKSSFSTAGRNEPNLAGLWPKLFQHRGLILSASSHSVTWNLWKGFVQQPLLLIADLIHVFFVIRKTRKDFCALCFEVTLLLY